jgi:hypothetical protein
MCPRERLGTFFAVVRLDDAAISDSHVMVKEIVSSEEEAIAEVERLNALNADGSTRYFWQVARHVRPAVNELAPEE